MATIPILRIKRIIEGLLNYISTNTLTHVTANTEEDSFLYQIWKDVNDDGFDFYEQGKDIFTRKNTSPSKLSVGLQYKRDIAAIPYIWVREPAKRKGEFNNIGDSNGTFINSEGASSELFRDTKRDTFEIVIVSNNAMATLLVAETLYHLLIAAHDTLTLNFTTFSFNMKEIITNNELTPIPIVMRSIEIDTQMDTEAPSINEEEFVNAVNFETKIYDEETGEYNPPFPIVP